MVLEKFTDNDGVKIRYLDNDPSHPVGLPILFATGIVDFADDYVETLEFFADRRVLVADLRGRGGSDAPPTGYSVLEQAGDLRSVLEVNGIGPFHLMTFSRGTTPGLELAFQLSDRVRTVSIGDYLPAEIALPPRVHRTDVDGSVAGSSELDTGAPPCTGRHSSRITVSRVLERAGSPRRAGAGRSGIPGRGHQ